MSGRHAGAADTISVFAYRDLWNIGPDCRSLRLDVGRPDHLAPLFGFLLKPPPVIRGRAAGDAAAQVSKLQPQFGARQRGVNLLVQFVDDLRDRKSVV